MVYRPYLRKKRRSLPRSFGPAARRQFYRLRKCSLPYPPPDLQPYRYHWIRTVASRSPLPKSYIYERKRRRLRCCSGPAARQQLCPPHRRFPPCPPSHSSWYPVHRSRTGGSRAPLQTGRTYEERRRWLLRPSGPARRRQSGPIRRCFPHHPPPHRILPRCHRSRTGGSREPLPRHRTYEERHRRVPRSADPKRCRRFHLPRIRLLGHRPPRLYLW